MAVPVEARVRRVTKWNGTINLESQMEDTDRRIRMDGPDDMILKMGLSYGECGGCMTVAFS